MDVTPLASAPLRLLEPTGDPRPYSLALQLRLVDLGLAEVTVIDGAPAVAVDPIFEAARAAAMAGFDEADTLRPLRCGHDRSRLRPTG